MHREISDVRQKTSDRTNRRRKSPRANFSVGDFVLFSTHIGPKSKLSLKWRGPARIVDCVSDHIFVIENLITFDRFECHAQRLRFYCDSALNVTQHLRDQIAFDDSGYEVENILDTRLFGKIWKLLIRWRGLSADYDSWESLSSLKKDIPVHLNNLLKRSSLPDASILLKLLPVERECNVMFSDISFHPYYSAQRATIIFSPPRHFLDSPATKKTRLNWTISVVVLVLNIPLVVLRNSCFGSVKLSTYTVDEELFRQHRRAQPRSANLQYRLGRISSLCKNS